MQDSGCFLNQFGDIRQQASRKMVESGSKALRGLTKGFEDGRKHAQLSCCCLQLCARLSGKQVTKLRAFEGSVPWVSCKMALTTA